MKKLSLYEHLKNNKNNNKQMNDKSKSKNNKINEFEAGAGEEYENQLKTYENNNFYDNNIEIQYLNAG